MIVKAGLTLATLFCTAAQAASGAAAPLAGPSLGPVPLEFIFFACVLAGVAMLHHCMR